MKLHVSGLGLALVMGWGVLCSSPAAEGIYHDRVNPHWFAGADGITNQFWYRVELPGGKHEIVNINAATGTRTVRTGKPDEPLDSLTPLTHSRPSRSSDTETEINFVNQLKEEVEIFWLDPTGSKMSYGKLAAGASRRQHTYAGHVWSATSLDGKSQLTFAASEQPGQAVIKELRAVSTPPRREHRRSGVPAATNSPSPDGKWEVFVRNSNLYLRATGSTNESVLTTNGTPQDSYARNVEALRGMEMEYDAKNPEHPTPEVYWAPDSKHFVALRATRGTQRKVYLVQSSPEDQVQPKLVPYPYLKAGDDVPYGKPHLFDVASQSEIPVADTLFANPWNTSDYRWDQDSSRLTFLFNQRGHQALRVLAINATNGIVTPIVDETNRTFIDYSGKFFCEYLDDSGEIIWMSERDGWNHLYLYDAHTGTVKKQITHGNWVVRKVDWVDSKNRQIWFQAGGIIPGQDPYYLHYCRVNFDGTGLTVLTAGNGTHLVEFSPDHQYLLDSWSRVDALPVTELRSSADGHLICPLESGTGKVTLPTPFVAKGRDGTTDIYGVVWLPKDFNKHKKYPVIEYIYAGPHDSFTPTGFHFASEEQKLANEGYIVVQMDGMGTANRSKAFHDVCWKNLRDAGFPDRILWIQAAAKQFPAMDLTRVGIYGTSAGGQDALRALLDHGDFYKAGIADSGCYDNRMDKIWWNEQWMGWPVDDSYTRSSCVVDAPKLQSKLLLMAGEMDKNVDPATTMQVVNALVKANKDFELFIMPNMGHGVLSTPYGWHRLEDFFARNLGAPK